MTGGWVRKVAVRLGLGSRNRLIAAAAIILLWGMFAQLIGGAVHDGVAADEDTHLASGLGFWRALLGGEPEVPRPFAINLLAALPVVGIRDLQRSDTEPELGPYLLPLRAYRPIDRVMVAGRFPVVLLSVLMAAVAYRWARSWYGHLGGLLTLAICVLDPNVLGHGRLVSTDAGLMVLGFLAAFGVTQLWSRPRLRTLVSSALALEGALQTKRTAIYLVPPLLVTVAVGALKADPARLVPARLRGRIPGWPGVVIWTLVLLLALALLTPLASRLFYWDWSAVSRAIRAPEAALAQVTSLGSDRGRGNPAFFMGQYSRTGWLAYFPVTFTIKTPLPTLLLLILALLSCVVARPQWRELGLVLFPLTLMAAVIVRSSQFIGYRHVLPALPFLFVFIGRLALIRRPRIWPVLVLLLLVWLVVWALVIYPHHLAFFNELVGGPANGYKYLADSNVDWGQANKELGSYLREHDIDTVRPALFTAVDPGAYGIRYDPLPTPWAGDWIVNFPRFDPPPGVYAIGATNLQGVYFRRADRDVFDWFRRREPTARVGYSIFVFEVDAPSTGDYQWVAMCSVPRPPLQVDEIRTWFGRNDLRVVYFDCEQSWVYPQLGTSGWYVLPSSGEDLPPLGRDHLAEAPVIYAAKSLDEPYVVVDWDADRASFSYLHSLREAEGAVTFGESLEYVGYRAPSEVGAIRLGSELTVDTVWEVAKGPIQETISFYAHLRDSEGALVATGDGVGVPPVQWLPGDWIAQRHSLTVDHEQGVPCCELWVGVYDFATGVRWAARDATQDRGDGLLVGMWRLTDDEQAPDQ